MRRFILTVVLVVACPWTPGPVQARPADGGPCLLDALPAAPPSDPDELSEALACLREIGRGDPAEGTTREALFRLATWLGASDAAPSRDRLVALQSATSLYPDDPRTPGLLRILADLQERQGDAFGAHLTRVRWIEREGVDNLDAATLAAAARAAAAAGDADRAFAWGEAAIRNLHAGPERTALALDLLAAAPLRGRFDLAAELLAALEADPEAGEALRVHAGALWGAALTYEALGRLDRAVEALEQFVNIHANAAQVPAALLKLGDVHRRNARFGDARRYYDWLVERAPDSEEAGWARLALAEMDARTDAARGLDAYVQVARSTRHAPVALEACRRIAHRLVAKGRSRDAVATLALVATDPDARTGAPACAQVLQKAAPSLMDAIAALEDPLELVLAARLMERAGVLIPQDAREVVSEARRRLGLDAPDPENLERRASILEAWVEQPAAPPLEAALDAGDADTVPLGWPELLQAEFLWRAGRERQALDLLRRLEANPGDPLRRRAARVLEADIRFSLGEFDAACRIYDESAAEAASPWLERQRHWCGKRRAERKEG